MSEVLVLDVGTTGLRAAIVDERLDIVDLEYRADPPSVPADGLVEFDAGAMAAKALDAAGAVLARRDRPVDAVGITNQRASVVLWDEDTGRPVAPGIGWQDLRTVGDCIVARAEHGWALAPNQSATKLSWLLSNTPDLDGRRLRAGTIDSWFAWVLSEGALHVSDHTNSSATTTGLRRVAGDGWNEEICAALGVPSGLLPRVVDSAGTVGAATALPGAPPIAALIGDQQASLIGQACVRPGRAKITFGTGGMLDVMPGMDAPTTAARNDAGTYPLPLWAHGGEMVWGVEGIMLSAGTNVEWMRDDLGLIETSAASHDVAAACDDAGGLVYVPALLGLGTPQWDYGARGTLLGITRGTSRAQVVRAVLEGIAHRGVDLLDAAEADTGTSVDHLRIDGGMSTNPTFVQALADASGRPVEVAPVPESTTIGAAFLAGLGIGRWDHVADVGELWRPAVVVEPDPAIDTAGRRQTWKNALRCAGEWIPELSALDF